MSSALRIRPSPGAPTDSSDRNDDVQHVNVPFANHRQQDLHHPQHPSASFPSPCERLRPVLSLMASPITDETGSLKSVIAGLCTLFVVGATIGLALPKNDTLPTPVYRSVSAAIGYVYFLAWSVSFYPQVISNYKRRSTIGLSPDFCVLNVLGFACYATYNVSFFWSPTIQELYRKRYGPNAEITVQSNDVAFALHALILSSITVLQVLYYGGGGLSSLTTTVSKPIVLIIVLILTVAGAYPILVVVTAKSGKETFNWLDFLYLLSFVKIGISLIKYIPQVLLNCQRKSTMGWSIWNILLDFTGGVLSVLQLVLDCADLKDFSGISGNPAKFGLGFVSILFDIVFMTQHYCLYGHPLSAVPNNNQQLVYDEQRQPLLSAGEEAHDTIGELEQQSPHSTVNEEVAGNDVHEGRIAETMMV